MENTPVTKYRDLPGFWQMCEAARKQQEKKTPTAIRTANRTQTRRGRRSLGR